MASSRHRETMSTYMQRSTLLRVKSYDLGTDCRTHGTPSWMMPDYVAFSTRILFDLAGAGVTPGRTRPSHCVGPSLSCRGRQVLPGATPASVQRETVKKSLGRSVSTISICGTMLRSRRDYQYATVEMLGFYIIIRYLENIIKN